MKVKPSQEILFYDGTPLKGSDGKVITVKDLIINSVNFIDQEGKQSGEDKNKAFEISIKVYSQEDVELSIDERSFILKMAEKALVPIAYGRLKETLEK